MNILLIAPSFPYPLTSGGRIRVFNIIRYLSRNHAVTLACVSEDTIADYGPLAEFCKEIRVVHHRNHRFRNGLLFVLGKEPYNAVRYASAGFQEVLKDLLRTRSFDAVMIEFPMMWQYSGLIRGLPVILDAHNIEYRLIGQMKESGAPPLKKILYQLEEVKMRRLEHRAWRECSLCITVSDRERDLIKSHLNDDRPVITAPNGVDLERFGYAPKRPPGRRLLFIGSMDYVPTVDSTRYLLEEIFPLIRSRIRGIELDIVGRSLWRIGNRPGTEGISLHENVPEILPFLRNADLLIDPLRMGGGTRLKVLEAMAAGVPVVTTSRGCEGIMVRDREHLLVADRPSDFAESVEKLLTDRGLSDRLAVNARRLMEERYSWEGIVRKMETAIGDLR